MISKPAADHPLQLVLGPSVWAVWFVIVYAGVSLACAWAPPDPARGAANGFNAALLVLTAATAALLAWAAWVCGRKARRVPPAEARSRSRFIAAAAAALYALSAVSTLFVGLPILVLPPCI